MCLPSILNPPFSRLHYSLNMYYLFVLILPFIIKVFVMCIIVYRFFFYKVRLPTDKLVYKYMNYIVYIAISQI